MRNRYILLADLPLVVIAAFGAFVLRFDWLFAHYRAAFVALLAGCLLIKPPVFYLFGMYGRYWRYATAQDLLAVTLAVSAASMGVATYVAIGGLSGFLPVVPRSIVLIDWLLTLVAAGGLRMSIRVIGDARQRAQKRAVGSLPKRVLVVGAGEAGVLVVREMQKNPQLGLKPVGFLDDAPSKLHKQIGGVAVLGPLSSLSAVVATYRIDEVVVAMPAVGGSVVRGVVEACRCAGVQSRAVPGVFELLDGHVTVSRLRSVQIEDLLRRNQVVAQTDTAHYLAGRTVLVTGAGGSIGFELCRQVAFAKPACLVLLGHGENSIFEARNQLAEQYPQVQLAAVVADIRDSARIDAVIGRFRPTVVFHAAAHKHVPLMEENPEEAVSNNVLGTSVVVDAAERYQVERLVLVSTDKAVSPTSVMGQTKRLAEEVVRTAASRTGRAFVVVRFGNVLGSRGSVVPILKRQIEKGGPVTLTHPDMERFFMTIPEAVHLVLKAGGMGRGGELFVLNMGDPVRITDLARDLITLSGLDVKDVGIQFMGLRPGERLREELWESDAVREPTDHADIFRVVEQPRYRSQVVPGLLPALIEAARNGDREAVQALLADCLPVVTSATATGSA